MNFNILSSIWESRECFVFAAGFHTTTLRSTDAVHPREKTHLYVNTKSRLSVTQHSNHRTMSSIRRYSCVSAPPGSIIIGGSALYVVSKSATFFREPRFCIYRYCSRVLLKTCLLHVYNIHTHTQYTIYDIQYTGEHLRNEPWNSAHIYAPDDERVTIGFIRITVISRHPSTAAVKSVSPFILPAVC